MKANSVLETIGRNPHIRLGRLFPQAEGWVKSERTNPGVGPDAVTAGAVRL